MRKSSSKWAEYAFDNSRSGAEGNKRMISLA